MHFFFLSRGIKHQRDQWVTHMQSQFWTWERTNLKTKKKETTFIQGSLRPIEMWEYVFPEEHLENVLKNMHVLHPDVECHKGANFKQQALLTILRKALGAEKLPDFKDSMSRDRVMSVPGMAIHPIGIKKDERKSVEEKGGEWGYEQEML